MDKIQNAKDFQKIILRLRPDGQYVVNIPFPQEGLPLKFSKVLFLIVGDDDGSEGGRHSCTHGNTTKLVVDIPAKREDIIFSTNLIRSR